MSLKDLRRWGMTALLLLTLSQTVIAQDTLRVMTYNLLRYGAAGIGCTPTGVTIRNPWITGILNLARPDIFGVNEIGPSSGPTSPANNLLVNILQPLNPAYRATTITYNSFQDVANMMYYNSDKVGLAMQAVIPEPTLDLRDLNYYKFYYKGPGLASGDTTFVEVVQVHLHASDEGSRTVQAADIMHFLDSLGRPGNFIVQGDLNLDGSTAPSYQNFVAHSNPDCKLNDLLGLVGNWHNNANCQSAFTQAPDPNPNNPCASGGPLDDRFDQLLVSNDIFNNAAGIRYIPGSHWVLGNPFAPNPSVGSTVLSNIRLMSDHHPVMINLEVSKAVSNAPARPTVDAMHLRGNPVANLIRLRLSLLATESGNCTLDLVSLSGQRVKSWSLEGNARSRDLELDASDIAAGAYFLRLLLDGQQIDTEKVMIGLR